MVFLAAVSLTVLSSGGCVAQGRWQTVI